LTLSDTQIADGRAFLVMLRAAPCLSWRPPNPPTADEVAQKARAQQG
jgi:hypothetical protein